MSKMQKKKPAQDKKRRVKSEKQGATESSGGAAVKAVSSASSSKVKIEKGSVDAAVQSENVFNKAAEFIREVKVELKKVVWPTRKQTTGTTVVVILFVFIVAAFLGLFDLGLSKLVQVVLT